MTGFADRWKDEWNDLPEDMRDFVTHAGPTDAHILLLGKPEHLSTVIHEAGLPEQRHFLDRVTRDLPNLLDPETTQPEELDVLWEQAIAILGEDLARRALLVLGPDVVADGVAPLWRTPFHLGEPRR